MSSVIKQVRIQTITKSYKYDGYCMVTGINGRDYKRKYYTRNSGEFAGRTLVYYEDEMYSFKWGSGDPARAFDIKWERSVEPKKDKPVTKVDTEEVEEIEQEEVVEAEVIGYSEDEDVKHEKYGTIRSCIESNIPVYLVGPAGSGKNHTLEQIAKELNLDFYFTNSVQQEYKLTGFIDAGGKYHETEFYRAFTKGGLFFLDEMDASIPEVLVLLNAAIANGYFEFPNGKVTAHNDFRVVSAGNTTGNGADEQYTGRLVLDQATLDRFAIIEFGYSEKIELHLAKGNKDLVSFIRQLRDEAKSKGIRATFSYRCISMVTKLEGKLKIEEIMQIAIMKGFDKSTVETFRPIGSTKYHNGLKRLQAQA